ncbi:MAG: sigma factor-like helix-turn-helix DNA-binding protein [Alphaproteobacteria bacterium]
MAFEHILFDLEKQAKSTAPLSQTEEQACLNALEHSNSKDALKRLYVHYAPVCLALVRKEFSSKDKPYPNEAVLSAAFDAIQDGIDNSLKPENRHLKLADLIKKSIRQSIKRTDESPSLQEVFSDSSHPQYDYDHSEEYEFDFDPGTENDYDLLIDPHAEDPIRATEITLLNRYITSLIEEKLRPNEREVLIHRFGIGLTDELNIRLYKGGWDDHLHTLEEIGEIIGLSTERIRLIETKAKKVLFTALCNDRNSYPDLQFKNGEFSVRSTPICDM